MSTIRAVAAAKHARTLSQPFRRTFYSPFAALQHSPLLNKPPSGSNGSVEAAHEHEREHAARTLYVVSEPNAAEFKYGVPAGAYPNAAPYHPMTPAAAAAAPSAHQNVSAGSSTSSSLAHPVLTRAAPPNVAGVGASAAVRFRSGLDLMDSR